MAEAPYPGRFFDRPGTPPNDTRPEPGEPVRRKSPAFAPEQGGASAKHFVASGSIQSRDADRPPVRDRQGVVRPGHGGTAPHRPQLNGPKAR